ncbi:MAG: TrmH family RNA methyltransferase [Chitinophagaceae bacterium]
MTEERIQRINNVLAKRQFGLTVVLENVEDPRNITAVMRSCDSVGIQDIHIVKTAVPSNKHFNFKSGRSAAKWLTMHHHNSIEECVTALRLNYQKIYTTALSANAVSVYDIDFTQSVALIFGNEITGVSAEAKNLADGNCLIPQVGFIQSLNISVACAVTIYEAFRQRNKAGLYNNPSFPENTMQDLKQLWHSYSDNK